MGRIIYRVRDEVHSDELPSNFDTNWGDYLVDLMAKYEDPVELVGFEQANFTTASACLLWKNVYFRDCSIASDAFSLCIYENVSLFDCRCAPSLLRYLSELGVAIYSKGKKVRYGMTNEEIAQRVHGKVFSLPNDKFVKVCCTCDFCHKDYERILNRANAEPFMNKVPNCDKLVCDSCYSLYKLREKEVGNRTYGYRGSLSYYRTPMDKENTAILGLEMEFEGDFYGWKELEDAHKGTLHYGYDSSVRGQNELSWDCGSYSWWKYLAPLRQVCDALKNNGGSEGPTAGIHIHVSRRDVSSSSIATSLFESVQTSILLRNALLAVSMRTDLDKMKMYANFDATPGHHHAAISYSSHGTVEFRIFQSSLDPNVILKRLLLCKTLFNLTASGIRGSDLLEKLPKTLKKHIIDCAGKQKDKGVLSQDDYTKLVNFLQKEDK